MADQTLDSEESMKPKRRKIPQKVVFSDLPLAFREAMGISSEIKSMDDVVESGPFFKKVVKDTISDFNPEDEEETERYNVPRILLEKRNTRIILFSKAWFKTQTILDMVNARHEKERWGYLKNIRAINKIREKFSRKSRPLSYENEEEKYLIEEGKYKQQEFIEKIALAMQNVSEDDEWWTDLQFKLIHAQQHFINNQFRNKCRYYKPYQKDGKDWKDING